MVIKLASKLTAQQKKKQTRQYLCPSLFHFHVMSWYLVSTVSRDVKCAECGLHCVFILCKVKVPLFVQICLVQLEITLDRWRQSHAGHLTSANSPRRSAAICPFHMMTTVCVSLQML